MIYIMCNTFCQTIAGPLLSKFSASHGIVMLSPSLRKYNTFGTTINFGGCWTITSIGVDAPSVPNSLNGVHVYLPPCSFSTYIYVQCAYKYNTIIYKQVKILYHIRCVLMSYTVTRISRITYYNII